MPMHEQLQRLGDYLDHVTGIAGSLRYLVILIACFVGYIWASTSQGSLPPSSKGEQDDDEDDEDDEPARNFTAQQLRHFDGAAETIGSKHNPREVPKPVYLSLNGIVFDVSRGREFYGPGGPYEIFAGRECGAALAKMSFDEEHLDRVTACEDLNFGERQELEGWIDKFTHYRNYPVRGRLVPHDALPDPNRVLTAQELAKHSTAGSCSQQEDAAQQVVPTGYAVAPIYIGAGGKVFDVSFGGVQSYGKGGPYHKFVGKDVSRALAKMSFDDIDNADCSDLTEKERKVLEDWVETFRNKKRYPVVGRLAVAEANNKS